jgi:hypothetical protein
MIFNTVKLNDWHQQIKMLSKTNLYINYVNQFNLMTIKNEIYFIKMLKSHQIP